MRKDIIPFILVTVGYLIFLCVWIVCSSWFLTPIIRALSPDERTRFSDTLIQVSGVLMGFSGLCAFFFIGKTAEISDRVYTESVRCSGEYSKSRITFETVKSTLFFLSPCLKGSAKKVVESIMTDIEEALKEMKTTDERLTEQVRGVEKIPKGASRLAVLEIFSIALFLVAFVLALISKLTDHTGSLDASLSVVVIAGAYMVYLSIEQLSFAGDANDLMREFISLSSKVSITQARAIEIKERVKDRNLIKYLDSMSKE